jgi:hypothetical protein
MLSPYRGCPWHSVGRRTLLIRRGLAKTATRKQLRDFVEAVLRLETRSDSGSADSSGGDEANKKEIDKRTRRSHFVQQVMTVSPMHNAKKWDYRKKVHDTCV